MKRSNVTRIPIPLAESEAREVAVGVAPPVRVCMHILHSARTDVRASRASMTLVEAGFTVSIIDVGDEGASCREELLGSVHVKHLVPRSSFVATRFERRALVRAAGLLLRGTLQLLRTPADVYHALDLPALPACYLAARIRRKLLVFEAYELPLSTLPVAEMSTSRRCLEWLVARLLPVMMRRCAGVIAVSPPIAEVFRQRYRLPEVSLIRNVPVYRKVAKTERLREALCLDSHVRIALYQGNLQRDRGLDLLVRAAPFLERNRVIVMMGPASEDATLAELEDLIAREGVADRVRILPSVPYDELLDWTVSADIGLIICPPRYALNVKMLLPNKLFEYLMSGVPVLASDLEAVAEVIKTYDVGWIVSSLTPADVGAAINAALADQAARDHMRVNALDAAGRVFCWDREKEELIRLYRRITCSRRSIGRRTRRRIKGIDRDG
jgi:glycosyltransferase involved in cell wall biosynthesis